MNNREDIILSEVVKAYLDTGLPVGSRTLSLCEHMHLSPASIRTVMGHLEQAGLLYSPHTSAGRIPTDEGLRYFVDTLMVVEEDIRKQAEELMNDPLHETVNMTHMLHRASNELARLTHYAGLVSVPEHGFSCIRRIELMPVSSEQILAVIVSDTGEVQNRLIPRNQDLPDSRLAEVSLRLNEMLQGCDVNEAKTRLMQTMEDDRLRIRSLTDGLMRWASAPAEPQQDLFISGTRQLLDIPELSVLDTIRSLMLAFDDKEVLLRLVNQMSQTSCGVKVFIGSEHALVNMEEVSVVLARYEGPGKVMGTLGVIGPKRMPYAKVLPVVDCTAKWVSHALHGIQWVQT